MANQVNGRLIAVSQLQTIASADPQKAPMQKREIFIDCTRFDPYTGQRSEYENKLVLEFVGKSLEKVSPVLDTLQKDDVVSVSFELQGRAYIEKGTNKQKYMTGVRCYDIQLLRKANGQAVAQQPTPQPAPQPQMNVQQVEQALNAEPAQSNDLPF